MGNLQVNFVSVVILRPGSREQLQKTGDSRDKIHHMNNNKLFVGNLSFNTTENDLQDTFAAHGTVVETNLMMDRMSGRPRGFAFVTMSTQEEAEKAIQALNGAQMDGRALTVNAAKPREERPAGGGGGGGRGGYGGGSGGGSGGGGGRERRTNRY